MYIINKVNLTVFFGINLINAYISTLVLGAFDYKIGVWHFFYVSVVVSFFSLILMGINKLELNALKVRHPWVQFTWEDIPFLKRAIPIVTKFSVFISYLILMVIILNLSGIEVIPLHLLIAVVPVLIFVVTFWIVFRRIHPSGKSDDLK